MIIFIIAIYIYTYIYIYQVYLSVYVRVQQLDFSGQSQASSAATKGWIFFMEHAGKIQENGRNMCGNVGKMLGTCEKMWGK